MFSSCHLPQFVFFALNRLEENGFSAYLVGGAVRDLFMNKSPKDFDITTSARPDEVLEIFSDYITIETGRRFGTITVISDNVSLEITTYRCDGNYLNNRSPENVSYASDIKEDLKRRDFTINALAWSPTRGFIDLFSGREDIKEKNIRTIGISDERFREDALRILRALRFSSVLGFCIENNTNKSIFKNKNLLLNISKERIRDEFNRIISGYHSFGVLIKYRNVIETFIPELSRYTEIEYSSAVSILSSPRTENDIVLRLAILFKFLNADTAGKILKGLKYDNKTIKGVKLLLSNLSNNIGKNKPELKILLGKLGEEGTKKLLFFKELCDIQSEDIKKSRHIIDEILINEECFSLKDLNLNGSDLISLGFSGSDIGDALNFALYEIIYERIPNEKSLIINHIMEKYKKYGNV